MIGRKLSHYEVIEVLGAGGMGVVYRAHDTKLGRDVAIKVLPADRPRSPRARLRFKREAMAASALNHPNIITIHEISSEGETEFIVMEYVRGVTLAALMKNRSLRTDEALHFAVQIAEALAKAHAAGVVHRDIKPGNVMITDDGLIKVVDFGVAKLNPVAGDDAETPDPDNTKEMTLTQPGSVTGTVFYMSPEQARGDKVDARSDIFSFGSVLFEMLTGKLPFTGANSVAVLHNLHFSPPRDLSELKPGLPDGVYPLLADMLEKDAAKRVQTMAEVAKRLRHCAGYSQNPISWQRPALSPETVERTVALPPAPKPFRRNLWIGAIALSLIATLAGGWWWYHRTHSPMTGLQQISDAPIDDTAYAHYQRARQYLDHYDLDDYINKAIEHLNRAVALDPKSAASYATLAEAYFQKNKTNPDPQWTKLASQAADQALAFDNYLAAAHTSHGLVLMEAGTNTEAETEFKKAIDLDPKNAANHMWLGSLYVRMGKGDLAAEEFARARALDSKDWRTDLAIGGLAFRSGRFQDAANSWQQALANEPNSAAILGNLGAAYHQLGRDDDAAAALQKALAIKPTSELYNTLGTIRFYQGHYDEAVPAFEKNVEMGANNFDNWANLGDAYRWSSTQKDKAKNAYNTAIRMVREEISKHPGQLDLQADLALYLAKSGEKAAALEALKPLETATLNDPNLFYLSATVYELCGNREKALKALTLAVGKGQPISDLSNDPELISLRTDPRYHLDVLSAASQETKP